MFMVLLRLTERKSLAPQFMAAHNAWIQRGFDDGVFVLVGGLQPKAGGALIAVNTSMEALQARVQDDPFVAQGIALPEIWEVSPSRTDERLGFLREAVA